MSDLIVAPETRDLDDLAITLAGWLARQMPGAQDVRIDNLDYPRGAGMSHETILFDAHWREGGEDRAAGLVVRIKPGELHRLPRQSVRRAVPADESAARGQLRPCRQGAVAGTRSRDPRRAVLRHGEDARPRAGQLPALCQDRICRRSHPRAAAQDVGTGRAPAGGNPAGPARQAALPARPRSCAAWPRPGMGQVCPLRRLDEGHPRRPGAARRRSPG